MYYYERKNRTAAARDIIKNNWWFGELTDLFDGCAGMGEWMLTGFLVWKWLVIMYGKL